MRRTSTPLLVDLGINVKNFKRHENRKSNTNAEGHVAESLYNKKQTGGTTTQAMDLLSTVPKRFNSPVTPTSEKESKKKQKVQHELKATSNCAKIDDLKKIIPSVEELSGMLRQNNYYLLDCPEKKNKNKSIMISKNCQLIIGVKKRQVKIYFKV